VNFWHYDPEEKGWYIYGQGSVAQDRKQVAARVRSHRECLRGALANEESCPPTQEVRARNKRGPRQPQDDVGHVCDERRPSRAVPVRIIRARHEILEFVAEIRREHPPARMDMGELVRQAVVDPRG
jgi:hypothetical protein